jgi:hypothetical protein
MHLVGSAHTISLHGKPVLQLTAHTLTSPAAAIPIQVVRPGWLEHSVHLQHQRPAHLPAAAAYVPGSGGSRGSASPGYADIHLRRVQLRRQGVAYRRCLPACLPVCMSACLSVCFCSFVAIMRVPTQCPAAFCLCNLCWPPFPFSSVLTLYQCCPLLQVTDAKDRRTLMVLLGRFYTHQVFQGGADLAPGAPPHSDGGDGGPSPYVCPAPGRWL